MATVRKLLLYLQWIWFVLDISVHVRLNFHCLLIQMKIYHYCFRKKNICTVQWKKQVQHKNKKNASTVQNDQLMTLYIRVCQHDGILREYDSGYINNSQWQFLCVLMDTPLLPDYTSQEQKPICCEVWFDFSNDWLYLDINFHFLKYFFYIWVWCIKK